MSAQRVDPPAPEPAWSSPARVGFETLMAEGPVLLSVNAAFPGVAPASHLTGPHVVLRFGVNLSPPIPDLFWDDMQLVGTLSFGGALYTCRVPWQAVVAIKSDGAAPAKPAQCKQPHLRLVP